MSGSSRIRLSAEEMAALPQEPPAPAGPPTPRPEPSPPESPRPPPESPPAPQETPPTEPGQPEEGDKPETPPEPEDMRRLRARIEGANREKWEWRKRAEEAQARLAQIEQAQRPQGYPDAVAQARAQLQQEAEVERFNAACNRTFQEGVTEFQDFQGAVDRLNAIGAAQNPVFLNMVASMPGGHRVYHALAQDVDEAGRIMRLPPAEMAIELARRAVTPPQANGQAPANPMTTRAPAPLRTIGGGSSPPPQSLEKISMAEFIRTRDKQEWERRYGPAG